MQQVLANGFRRLWSVLPRSKSLFQLSRMYVDFCNGENNPDFRFNGELLTLRRLLPKCKVAFDVGANVGDWTSEALAINPSLQVHCFEPSARTFAELSARKLPPQVKLNHLAFSSEPGEATLYLHETASNLNSLYAEASSGQASVSGTETIQLQPLDDYCRSTGVERIDYLKIDTEGHELAVLRGANRMLSTHAAGYVQVEYSDGYLEAGALLRDVFTLMQGHGYRAYKITPKGLVLFEKYQSSIENFRLCNWLFAAPGREV